MSTVKSVKSAPALVPLVPVVKKTVFAFKTRLAIAPKGLQKATYVAAVNEMGGEDETEFNHIVKSVVLEAKDAKGMPWVLTKKYNIMANGRGAKAFIADYNAWSGSELSEDDLYEKFDGEADNGKSLVVEVGHRKVGKEWESYIMAFHPEGYTGEITA